MAGLIFKCIDIQDREIQITNIQSYRLSRDYDAPCDSMRLNFIIENSLTELKKLKAYYQSKLIFNGVVDTQREQMGKDGIYCFVYARSTACTLVDNQALPLTYNCPSANSLFFHNAYPFGFKSDLPELYAEYDYQVSKGKSCYGAINDFVYGICGKNILIDVDNQIYIPDENQVVDLSGNEIISEKHIINRGNPISRIDYKLNSSVNYCYHIKSKFFEEKDISRSKKMNISSMPLWQQGSALNNSLKISAREYELIEITMVGFVNAPIGVKANYQGNLIKNTDDYYISSLTVCADDKGVYSKIVLSRNIDLQEVNYVAE